MTQQPPPPPGWYPDYGDPQLERYWGGSAWTAQTRPKPPPPSLPPPPAAPVAPYPAQPHDLFPSVLPQQAPGTAAPAQSWSQGRPLSELLSRPLWIAFGSAVAVVIGSLLPWVTVLVFSVNGVQTNDGKIVLVAGLLAGALIIGSSRRESLYLLGGVAGLVCLAVSLYVLVRVFSDSTSFFNERIGASPGAGLWISLLGSAVLVGAVVKQRRSRQRS